MRPLLFVPLALFAVIVALIALGLWRPASPEIRSRLVGRPLPAFSLPPAVPGHPGLARADLAGRPRLLNIFASWCVPCAAEAPQLVALKRAGVTIDAVAVRDRPADVAAFLARWGDPYARIGADAGSHVQMALGSSGVPESFVVDANGVIRHQHIGDIRPEHVAAILAEIEEAR